jgi:ADP-heptose:LPS heptosyltransferase
LGALCALAGAAIGNDSGPRHIAAASGARTLTLFGPEGLREWQPYRREDGHWALQAPGGAVEGIDVGLAARTAGAWLKFKARGRGVEA